MKSGGIFCVICGLLFISVHTHAQQWDWVQRFSADSSGTAIGVDGEQNVYVAGTFTGTNYLGTNRFVSAGGSDVFLLKLNPDGQVEWAVSTGGDGSDSVHRLAVATNGALFVVGNFTITASLLASSFTNQSGNVSNAFVARVDHGKFTWFETLSPEVAGLGAIVPVDFSHFQSSVNGVGGVAFGPDESLWVIAASNVVFIRKYAQDGTVLGSFVVDKPLFFPNGIAVSGDEHVFITGRSADYHYFTAALDRTGRVEWSWDAGHDGREPNPIYAIACTPDFGVVTIAAVRSGFNWAGVILKHSANGIALWQQWKSIFYKSVFSPRAVVLDSRGNIHVTGRRVNHYLSPQVTDGLWLFSTEANGNAISESSISSRRFSFRWNLGTAIAATSDGAIYITGALVDTAIFGTNFITGFITGSGSSAFVARRSTLQPELVAARIDNNVILSWPRAAFPFALQQSDETGTNWSFVTQLPERIGQRHQVTLAAELATGMFRLLRTNESLVRYPPRMQWLIRPEGAFLDHNPVIVLPPNTGTVSRTFAASVSADGPGGRITFDSFNADTGEPLTATRVFSILADIDPYSAYIQCYCTRISSSDINFSAGKHNVALVVSDGVDHFTNSVRFEVITFDTALQELRSALEPLTVNRAGRRALALFEGALRVGNQRRTNLAEKRWRHFQRQLTRIHFTSDEERNRLSAAASMIEGLTAQKQQ